MAHGVVENVFGGAWGGVWHQTGNRSILYDCPENAAPTAVVVATDRLDLRWSGRTGGSDLLDRFKAVGQISGQRGGTAQRGAPFKEAAAAKGVFGNDFREEIFLSHSFPPYHYKRIRYAPKEQCLLILKWG